MSLFELGSDRVPDAAYQFSNSSRFLVSENKIFKGFYYIWVRWPSWSCDLDRLNRLSFPHPMEAPLEYWL